MALPSGRNTSYTTEIQPNTYNTKTDKGVHRPNCNRGWPALTVHSITTVLKAANIINQTDTLDRSARSTLKILDRSEEYVARLSDYNSVTDYIPRSRFSEGTLVLYGRALRLARWDRERRSNPPIWWACQSYFVRPPPDFIDRIPGHF